MRRSVFAFLGFKDWAESYIAEAQRKNQFTLPNSLSTRRTALPRYLASVRAH